MRINHRITETYEGDWTDEWPSEEIVHKVQEVRTEESKLVTMEGKVNEMRMMYTNVDGTTWDLK